MTEETSNIPVVQRMDFTFTKKGLCIYCQAKCTRTHTIRATSIEEAQKRADELMKDLFHKKCGGY